MLYVLKEVACRFGRILGFPGGKVQQRSSKDVSIAQGISPRGNLEGIDQALLNEFTTANLGFPERKFPGAQKQIVNASYHRDISKASFIFFQENWL